ncbi:MAG: hypothetical protein GY953_57165 [bacterium]|nr:hypothetical protein [bacterium]
MNTTHLFVELVVIGTGAMAWVLLTTVALFGYDWIPADRIFTTPALVPILAVVYLFGIVTDRAADGLFERIWGRRLRMYKGNSAQYFADRHLMLSEPSPYVDFYEYGTSRLRICRGWAFNSPLIMCALNLLMILQFREAPRFASIVLFGTLSLCLLSVVCWLAWRQLKSTQVKKLREGAEFLRERSS